MTSMVVLVVVCLVDPACPRRVAGELSGVRRHITLTLTLTLLDLTSFDMKTFGILCSLVPDADIWSTRRPFPDDRGNAEIQFPVVASHLDFYLILFDANVDMV